MHGATEKCKPEIGRPKKEQKVENGRPEHVCTSGSDTNVNMSFRNLFEKALPGNTQIAVHCSQNGAHNICVDRRC